MTFVTSESASKNTYDIVCLRVEFQFLVYFVHTKVKKTVL